MTTYQPETQWKSGSLATWLLVTVTTTAVCVLGNLIWGNTVLADSTPSSYYRVADLQDGDHLNVRAEPTASSADLGDLKSGSQPYEVIETDASGEWGRILWLESSGWVALSYMEPIEVEQLAKTEVPVGLICAGTEPFWTFEIQSQQTALISTSESTHPLSVIAANASSNRAHFPVAVELQSENYQAISMLRRSDCADGMSDISYGWNVDLVIQPQLQVLSGCCFLR